MKAIASILSGLLLAPFFLSRVADAAGRVLLSDGRSDYQIVVPYHVRSRVDLQSHCWCALVIIPFKSLATEPPVAGAIWRGNFARNHHLPRGKIDRAIWSSTITSNRMNDRSLFGDIIFQKP